MHSGVGALAGNGPREGWPFDRTPNDRAGPGFPARSHDAREIETRPFFRIVPSPTNYESRSGSSPCWRVSVFSSRAHLGAKPEGSSIRFRHLCKDRTGSCGQEFHCARQSLGEEDAEGNAIPDRPTRARTGSSRDSTALLVSRAISDLTRAADAT
jgi:hypothetical protein